MNGKGFSYSCTNEEIRAHMKLSPKDKLAWLEAANRLTRKVLKGRTKKIWEMFRKGEI